MKIFKYLEKQCNQETLLLKILSGISNQCIIYRYIAESEVIQLRLRSENFLNLVPDVVQTHLTQIEANCFK